MVEIYHLGRRAWRRFGSAGCAIVGTNLFAAPLSGRQRHVGPGRRLQYFSVVSCGKPSRQASPLRFTTGFWQHRVLLSC